MQSHRNRTHRLQGIVLARRDWGEADRLLTLFTPDKGKVRALAVGARKPTSRKSGHVELLSQGTFMIAQGRTFDKLVQAETNHYFGNLRAELERVSVAYVLTELVDKFMEEQDENPMVYDLLLSALTALDEGAPPALVLRYFEINLLGFVGYQPQLYNCSRCERILEAVAQYFDITEASAVCPDCAANSPVLFPLSVESLKVLRFLQVSDWGAVRGLRLNETLNQEIETLLQRTTSFLLDRDVKAVRFMDQL